VILNDFLFDIKSSHVLTIGIAQQCNSLAMHCIKLSNSIYANCFSGRNEREVIDSSLHSGTPVSLQISLTKMMELVSQATKTYDGLVTGYSRLSPREGFQLDSRDKLGTRVG